METLQSVHERLPPIIVDLQHVAIRGVGAPGLPYTQEWYLTRRALHGDVACRVIRFPTPKAECRL